MYGKPLAYLLLETEISAVEKKAGGPVVLQILRVVQIRFCNEISNRCPKEIKQC